jgi:lysophospholipase L1-like esterase
MPLSRFQPFSRFRASCLASASLLMLAASASAQQVPPPFGLHDGDRVVFYGDSITDQRLYTTDVENYVITRFPTLNIRFVHSGWGGDTVRGGGGGPIDLRLPRDVIAYHPTVMTIMLGMNDGGYHAFDDKTFDAYTQGYTHILDTVQAALPGLRLTLIQASPYDDVTRAPGFAGGYNAVLVRYGQFVKETAQKGGLGVADMNTPMVAMLTKANATDPAQAQKILPDRVHPSPAGHLVMAKALLKSWNAPAVITDVWVDASGKKVVRAENSRVSALTTGKTISWTQNDAALPLPLQSGEPLTALVLKSSDFLEALDQENLRVSGLKPEARYTLRIDGQDVGDFTGELLSSGINLATLPTPMARQAAAVAALTNQHNDQHFQRWRTIQVPLEGHKNGAVSSALPPLLAALDAEEAETVARRHEAAQPVPHRYEIAFALPEPTGPNLALGKPYTTSAPNNYGYGIGGLTDGSWEASGAHTFATDDADTFPKTATVDLGAPARLGAVRVGVPPFGSTKTIRVSLSVDGLKFTEVGSYVFSQRYEEKHRYRFSSALARYIRLTFADHYNEEADFGRNFAFVTEVEAYAPATP